MPERDQTRINERIGVREVRLVDEDGKQIGVIETKQALAMAQERDLDLVEVAPDSRPPVARLLDYSKYKYELEQKAKAARKHQQQINVREIKLRPKIADHDYGTKKGHVERFLRGGDKVKVTIMFRGREQAHPERGRALLARLFEDLEGLGVVEQNPLQEGRNMHMLVAPSKEALRDQKAKTGEQPAVPDPEVAPAAEAEEPAEADASAQADATDTPAEAEASGEADEETVRAQEPIEAGEEPAETEAPAETDSSHEQQPEAATS
ncbi:MAG: translation initiation factor IF-3 [Actinomycetota bacterium]|nr:translation initiation factor IF-3 [Actinomycetota bacterium]